MSELTDKEFEFTHEHNIHELRKKDIATCNVQELRIRVAYDEMYIKSLEKEYTSLKAKYEGLKASLEANRDIDEEFE